MHSRLDGVLARNRSHALRDLGLAAFLFASILFSSFSVGSALPKLILSPRAMPLEIAAAPSAPAAPTPGV